MDHPTVAVTAARVPAARVPAARVPAARVPTARFARVEGVEGVATALRREEIPVALVDETRRVRITYHIRGIVNGRVHDIGRVETALQRTLGRIGRYEHNLIIIALRVHLIRIQTDI